MSTIVAPLIIQGPAVIEHNSVFTYVQKDVTVTEENQDFDIVSGYGTRDKRFLSRKLLISYTPVGQMTSSVAFNKRYPHGPAQIGKSIFPVSPVAKIHSIAEGKVHIFSRAGISKYAEMYLGPGKQPLGQEQMTAIGKSGGVFTDSDYFKQAMGTETFADSSFDDTKIFSDIYAMAIGERSSPFDAVGAHEVFTVKPTLKTKDMYSANAGVAEIIVEDLSVSVDVAPNNLTDANVDDLLALQGSDAMIPGQSYAKNDDDLVISSDSFTATLYRMGAQKSDRTFEKGEHRMKMLTFTNKRYGSIVAASPLWLFTVN